MRKILYFTIMRSSKIIYIILFSAYYLIFNNNCQGQNFRTQLRDHSTNVSFSKSECKGRDNIKENHQLVNLFNIIPYLKTEFYYATINNFTHEILYKNPAPYLVAPAANALAQVADSLAKRGLGILLFDAYRPHSVSKRMWDIVQNPDYVADPSKGSNHNRGLAVDISLYRLDSGTELAMPTPFDDFSEKAHHDYNLLPDKVKHNRNLLKNIMQHFGFSAYKMEWWHYTFITDNKYEVLNITFDELNTADK